MPKLSILQLSVFTGKTRPTVRSRLDGLPFEDGGKNGKLYDSKLALEKIYQVSDDPDNATITNAEATRQLTIARKEQIDLEMEVTRKERIPLEIIEAVNDRVFSNVAGMLKAHRGKRLTEDGINDILAELRSVGSAVRHG